MRYWVGPYVGDGLTTETAFRAPDGAWALPDLRKLSAKSQIEFGFFCTPNAVALDANYREFLQGDVRQDAPREADRAVWASMLGIPAPAGTTLLDWVWEALTVNADPDGIAAPRPLTPNNLRALELHFGGHSLVRSKAFDFAMPEAAPVLASMRNEYRKLRIETLAGRMGDPLMHRKMLDWWGEKFNLNNPEDVFIPSDLPKERRVKHGTTRTDDFNRADQGFIGTSSEGWSWTAIIGGSGNDRITSNQAAFTGTGSAMLHRADGALTGTDHQAQIDFYCSVAGSGTAGGPIARKDNTSTRTFYLSQHHRFGNCQLYSCSGGSFTQLVSVATTYVSGAPVLLIVNGSTITGKYNGTQFGSTTDSTISTGSYCGMRFGGADNSQGDNFTASDLGGAAAPLIYPMLSRYRAIGGFIGGAGGL